MDLFDISAISTSSQLYGPNQLSVTNLSAISELPGLGETDISCSYLSASQAAELSLRLSTAERSFKQFRIETDRQISSLKADVQDREERASRYEIQLTETSQRADALFQSFSDDMHKLTEQNRTAEAEKLKVLQLNADLSADLDRKRNELANVKMQLTMAEDRAARSAANADRQTAELRLLHGKYNMTKKRLFEAAKMKARIEALESENDRLLQQDSAKSRLASDLQRLSELDQENSRLKSQLSVITQYNENVDVLREKVSHLTSSLDAAKADLSRLSSLETENSYLKEKLGFLGLAGAGEVAGGVSLEHVSALSDRVKQLEATTKLDFAEITSLRETLSVVRAAKSRQDEEITTLKANYAQLEEIKAQESEALSKAQSQLALSTTERDTCRHLLQLVERHLGYTGSPLSSHAAAQVRVPTIIRELEASFDAHKTEVARIRSELDAAKQKAALAEAELATAREESATAKTALSEKTSEMAVLQFEHARFKNMLEASSGRQPTLDDDEEVDQGGAIVHLKENPADCAFRDWLIDESANLERHRRQQSGAATSDGAGMNSAEAEDFRRRIEALERAIERKEKDLRATREMAAFSLKELHSAVTHLLGYELNLNAADKIYSLRSAYAEPAELFLFKPRHQKSGGVSFQLLETDMARRFKDSVQLYVIQHQSIPAFLASVTSDLFSKQTLIA